MNIGDEENVVNGGSGMRWMVGLAAGVLLMVSLGLEVFARQAHAKVSLATILLALYLAAWAYVVALAGLALLSAWGIGRYALTAGRASVLRVSAARGRRRLATILHLHRKRAEGQTKAA